MEINYIKRKDLDVEKYDSCIENSIQSRIYAFSWYLDIVADNWDVLVLDDYKAVMPVPWKRKYGIKYVAQPPYCQQLGVFSLEEFNQELLFINQLKRKFKKINYNFNTKNRLSDLEGRVNYILKLDKDHATFFKNFSKGRKHAVKKAVKNKLSFKDVEFLELVKMKKEFYPQIKFPEKRIFDLVEFAKKNSGGFTLGIYDKGKLLGGAFFLKSNKRIVYLFSAFNKELRDLQASSFLIDVILKKYQKTNFTLDFEGSNFPNIALFFRSFGAKNEAYKNFNYRIFSKKKSRIGT